MAQSTGTEFILTPIERNKITMALNVFIAKGQRTIDKYRKEKRDAIVQQLEIEVADLENIRRKFTSSN